MKGLRWTAAAIVALAGCFFLLPERGLSVAAAENVCPPYRHAVNVRFKMLTPDPIYNHRLNIGGIKNLFLTRGRSISAAHERALGVTYSEVVFYLEGNTRIVPRSGGYCVYLETIGAEFGWKRMEVHIAREFPRGTCEYNAVLDLAGEFYLDTIRIVFQEHALPRGQWTVAGQLVRPQDIKKTALFTIEGELDDISGPGQTRAAHTLCSNIPESKKQDFEVPGAGHYGIFSGRRWRNVVAPRITQFIKKHVSSEAGTH